MIKSYALTNYKCLNLREDIELSNLTIISGINNSGKSAFIKSILDLYNTDGYQATYVPSITNFTSKVYNNQKNRKINYAYSFDVSENRSIELKVKFAYCNKNSKAFVSDYTVLINEKDEKQKYLKLKKKSFEDQYYTIDSYLMMSLLFGVTIEDDLPERFQGQAEVKFYGYHPIRIIAKPEINPILKEYFDFTDDKSITFSVYGVYDLVTSAENVTYIGPLRSTPKEYYLLDKTNDKIDQKGDNIIEVYNNHKDSKVIHKKEPNGEVIEEKLSKALNYWFKYFFDDANLKVHKVSENLYQLLINGHSIKHSGFGFSQLLPVIIQALLLPKLEILLLEQPEIHLHPELEMKLAYFLLCMANADKQIILETHSEHMVNKLILETMKNKKIEDSYKIYFFEKKPNQKTTSIIPIQFNKHGNVIKWPDGFFDQYSKFSKDLFELRKQNK